MAAKKFGRPAMFSQALADVICGRIAEGESLRSICSENGMPSRTSVFKWLSTNPGFVDQYARARDTHADNEFDGLCDLADEPPAKKVDGSIDPGWVAHQRLRIDTRKWALSKLAPKKYGERTEVAHSGTIGVRAAQDLTDDELATIAAGGSAGVAGSASGPPVTH